MWAHYWLKLCEHKSQRVSLTIHQTCPHPLSPSLSIALPLYNHFVLLAKCIDECKIIITQVMPDACAGRIFICDCPFISFFFFLIFKRNKLFLQIFFQLSAILAARSAAEHITRYKAIWTLLCVGQGGSSSARRQLSATSSHLGGTVYCHTQISAGGVFCLLGDACWGSCKFVFFF